VLKGEGHWEKACKKKRQSLRGYCNIMLSISLNSVPGCLIASFGNTSESVVHHSRIRRD
jgi:hypothetical protein